MGEDVVFLVGFWVLVSKTTTGRWAIDESVKTLVMKLGPVKQKLEVGGKEKAMVMPLVFVVLLLVVVRRISGEEVRGSVVEAVAVGIDSRTGLTLPRQDRFRPIQLINMAACSPPLDSTEQSFNSFTNSTFWR